MAGLLFIIFLKSDKKYDSKVKFVIHYVKRLFVNVCTFYPYCVKQRAVRRYQNRIH